MARVLLIDDDPGTLSTVRAILQLSGHEVSVASTGGSGLRVAAAFRPDVALVDVRLPDLPGLEVVTGLQSLRLSTRCVVVTAFGDLSTAVDAFRRGASDFVEKPMFEEDILAAVNRALESLGGSSRGEAMVPEAHDLARWADAVVRFMTSPKDAKTLAAFGRIVGASTGAYRNWCRTASLSARRSLQFARGLRAVRLHQAERSARPQKYLDIVDLRTLSKFLVASGGTPQRLPPTIEIFLERQSYVDAEAVSAVRSAMASAHLQPKSPVTATVDPNRGRSSVVGEEQRWHAAQASGGRSQSWRR